MKLKHKHRQMILLGIGLLFILSGIIQWKFNLQFNKTISDVINFALILIAVFIFISGRNDNNNDSDNDKE